MTDKFTRRAALRLPAVLGLGGLLSKIGVAEPPERISGLVMAVADNTRMFTWQIAGARRKETPTRKAAKRALELLSLRNERRIDGLDPDLASLKSVSPAMKRHIQMARIADRYDWVSELQALANGWFPPVVEDKE